MSDVVVADSSPLIALRQIGRLDLLRELFRFVLIPPAVAREVSRTVPILPEWVHTETLLGDLDSRLAGSGLDPGECEAITLAIERRADYVLCDDRDARLWMELLGLQPLGCIGILLRAKRLGLLPAIKPPLDDLVAAGLFVGDRLYHHVLTDEGEVTGDGLRDGTGS